MSYRIAQQCYPEAPWTELDVIGVCNKRAGVCASKSTAIQPTNKIRETEGGRRTGV